MIKCYQSDNNTSAVIITVFTSIGIFNIIGSEFCSSRYCSRNYVSPFCGKQSMRREIPCCSKKEMPVVSLSSQERFMARNVAKSQYFGLRALD